jgi:hypothetical protein
VKRTAAVGVVAVLAIAVGAFFGGRASVQQPKPHPGTYDAGYEAAFGGFDGGWVFGAPYIVTLKHAGNGLTYKFARRWPVQPGVQYRSCPGQIICTRR